MNKKELKKKIEEAKEFIRSDAPQAKKDEKTEEIRSLAKSFQQTNDLVNLEKGLDEDNKEDRNIVPKGKDGGNENKDEHKFPERRSLLDNQDDKLMEKRSAINDYLHSKGSKRSDNLELTSDKDVIIPSELRDAIPANTGIKSTDVNPIIPTAVSYIPQDEVKTIIDLSKYVNKIAVKTASGSYPVRKKATGRLNTTEELEENPKLAKPNFKDVDYKVATRRGAEPVSQESIDDAAIDLIPFLIVDANEQKVNTTNYDISAVLKGFTGVTIKSLDDIKKINNVVLDQAYNRSFVVSGSFYQWLDTLKDGNGRYLLHDDITSASGKSLLDVPVFKIDDDLFGEKGEAHAWFGDLKKAILYADRAQITARWVTNEVYGQILQVGTRYDVKPADESAGYFMSLDAKATSDDTATVKDPAAVTGDGK